ncbi:hypothetical protein GGR38_002031 [Novosphingobium sediminicola]|uniref:Uncharacterized protein n=1 Tax=Novosphingobium sediminicola TaxID=563162 RepID=A0A7W6CEK3_9SPHN|nr:hypothetical protein [Novosphingobium sediminicola]
MDHVIRNTAESALGSRCDDIYFTRTEDSVLRLWLHTLVNTATGFTPGHLCIVPSRGKGATESSRWAGAGPVLRLTRRHFSIFEVRKSAGKDAETGCDAKRKSRISGDSSALHRPMCVI